MQFMMRSSQKLSLQQPSIQILLMKCTFHARLKLRKIVLMLLQCHYLLSQQLHKVTYKGVGHACVVTYYYMTNSVHSSQLVNKTRIIHFLRISRTYCARRD